LKHSETFDILHAFLPLIVRRKVINAQTGSVLFINTISLIEAHCYLIPVLLFISQSHWIFM